MCDAGAFFEQVTAECGRREIEELAERLQQELGLTNVTVKRIRQATGWLTFNRHIAGDDVTFTFTEIVEAMKVMLGINLVAVGNVVFESATLLIGSYISKVVTSLIAGNNERVWFQAKSLREAAGIPDGDFDTRQHFGLWRYVDDTLIVSYTRCDKCCAKALTTMYTHSVDITMPKDGWIRWLDVDILLHHPGSLRVVEKNTSFALGEGPKTKASLPPYVPGLAATVSEVRGLLTGRASRYGELGLHAEEISRATGIKILELVRDGYPPRFLRAAVYGMRGDLRATWFFRQHVRKVAKFPPEKLESIIEAHS